MALNALKRLAHALPARSQPEDPAECRELALKRQRP